MEKRFDTNSVCTTSLHSSGDSLKCLVEEQNIQGVAISDKQDLPDVYFL